METWIKSNTIHNGKVLTLRVGDVRLDDNSVAQREVIEHSGGVAIVPVLGDSVILIRQYRISIGRKIIEIPAGRLDDHETPEECAHRELEEEIGYKANQLVRGTTFFSAVGYSNEKTHIFFAFDLEKTEQNLEWDERIEIIKLSLQEIEEKLSRNEFEDSKTIIGLHELLAYQKRQSNIP
jgi:ADP-ribose pyrophosphatase